MDREQHAGDDPTKSTANGVVKKGGSALMRLDTISSAVDKVVEWPHKWRAIGLISAIAAVVASIIWYRMLERSRSLIMSSSSQLESHARLLVNRKRQASHNVRTGGEQVDVPPPPPLSTCIIMADTLSAYPTANSDNEYQPSVDHAMRCMVLNISRAATSIPGQLLPFVVRFSCKDTHSANTPMSFCKVGSHGNCQHWSSANEMFAEMGMSEVGLRMTCVHMPLDGTSPTNRDIDHAYAAAVDTCLTRAMQNEFFPVSRAVIMPVDAIMIDGWQGILESCLSVAKSSAENGAPSIVVARTEHAASALMSVESSLKSAIHDHRISVEKFCGQASSYSLGVDGPSSSYGLPPPPHLLGMVIPDAFARYLESCSQVTRIEGRNNFGFVGETFAAAAAAGGGGGDINKPGLKSSRVGQFLDTMADGVEKVVARSSTSMSSPSSLHQWMTRPVISVRPVTLKLLGPSIAASHIPQLCYPTSANNVTATAAARKKTKMGGSRSGNVAGLQSNAGGRSIAGGSSAALQDTTSMIYRLIADREFCDTHLHPLFPVVSSSNNISTDQADKQESGRFLLGTQRLSSRPLLPGKSGVAEAISAPWVDMSTSVIYGDIAHCTTVFRGLAQHTSADAESSWLSTSLFFHAIRARMVMPTRAVSISLSLGATLDNTDIVGGAGEHSGNASSVINLDARMTDKTWTCTAVERAMVSCGQSHVGNLFLGSNTIFSTKVASSRLNPSVLSMLSMDLAWVEEYLGTRISKEGNVVISQLARAGIVVSHSEEAVVVGDASAARVVSDASHREKEVEIMARYGSWVKFFSALTLFPKQ